LNGKSLDDVDCFGKCGFFVRWLVFLCYVS